MNTTNTCAFHCGFDVARPIDLLPLNVLNCWISCANWTNLIALAMTWKHQARKVTPTVTFISMGSYRNTGRSRRMLRHLCQQHFSISQNILEDIMFGRKLFSVFLACCILQIKKKSTKIYHFLLMTFSLESLQKLLRLKSSFKCDKWSQTKNYASPDTRDIMQIVRLSSDDTKGNFRRVTQYPKAFRL